ncbi:MAG TPA: 2-oxoacid:ferredoxin oxidoreductase subunit beta [Armatimonadota bacterium]|nr:2-oxoacid:ferredoxin oxidoreductase subunit beta [Armatimonadota bacterium]
MDNVRQYLRQQTFPHIWCAGCGNGIVLYAILSAIDKLGLDKDKVAMVSGIGCSSRAPGYVDFNTLHTTHGRALPFATGIKLAKPEMTVIVVTGDGDATAIGGNHLIHAARRNLDLTVVLFNNSTYGMTSGQYSPTTPTGAFGTTAPYGNAEQPFDICNLAEAAGATYVASGTTYHAKVLPNLIEKAISNKGFSLVETITQCPIYFGRMNKIGNSVEMMKWQKEHAVTKKQAETMSPEELADKFIIGELCHKTKPDYCELYDRIIEKAQASIK